MSIPDLHGRWPVLRLVLFCALSAGLAVCEAAWLFVAPEQRFPVGGAVGTLPAFGRGATVSQTFVTDVPTLIALQVRLRGNGSADIEWEVSDVEGAAPRVLARGTRPVAVRGEAPFDIPLPPTREAGRRLCLTLRRSGDTPVPLALAVSEVNSYPGPLTVDGREQFADLALAAVGRSRAAGLVGSRTAFRSPVLDALLFLTGTCALLTFVYFMVFAEEEQGSR